MVICLVVLFQNQTEGQRQIAIAEILCISNL